MIKYRKDFESVINNGTDFDMSQICSCTYKTMNECEKHCLKYHDCYNIAMANDILRDFEDFCYENKTWKQILEEYVSDDKVSVSTKEENGICVMAEYNADEKRQNIVMGKSWLEVLEKSGYMEGIKDYVLEMSDEDEFWADEGYFNREQEKLIWEYVSSQENKNNLRCEWLGKDASLNKRVENINKALNIIGEAVKLGVLTEDPDNSQNIFVYMRLDNGKEAWVSQNKLEAAIDLVNQGEIETLNKAVNNAKEIKKKIGNETNLNCDIVQSINFDAVMTYDDWTIFRFKNRYYVADDDIREVTLVSKCKPEDYTGDDPDVIWLDADYCGESDDGKWYLGFDRIKNKEKDREDRDYAEFRIKDGYFRVDKSADPNYPGIDIEFISDDDLGNSLSRPRILFEKTENGNLRALAWNNPDKEDFVEEIEFSPKGERCVQ